MNYTLEQQDIFSEMFRVIAQFQTYKQLMLEDDGLSDNGLWVHEDDYSNVIEVVIHLGNGSGYLLDVQRCLKVEETVIEIFNEFIQLDYDEELFQVYLNSHPLVIRY